MTQILLSIIAVVLASGAGILVMLNLRAQSTIIEHGNNEARLDEIASLLSRSVTRIPGSNHFALPAADTSGGWAQLPSSVTGNDNTFGDVPFAYCPVGRLSTAELSGLSPVGTQQISMPEGSYSASTYGGLVVETNVSLDSAVVSQLSPVGILTAAIGKAVMPPNCTDVKLVNGVPFVEGGMVRVISEPAGSANADVSKFGGTAEFWVSDTGQGSGLRRSEPMQIDKALKYYVDYRPDNFILNIGSYVHASDGVWQSFIANTQSSGGSITFKGLAEGAAIRGVQAGLWPSPARLTIENLILYGPAIGVEAGDEVILSGAISLSPSSSTYGIHVYPGGKLTISDASINLNKNWGGIFVEGEMTSSNSKIYAGRTDIWYIINASHGNVDLRNTSINRKGSGLSATPIQSEGYARFVTDSLTTVGKSTGGKCWHSDLEDYTFAYSNQVNSQVPSESNYPPPANMNDLAAVEVWQLARAKRLRARRQNGSQMSCV